jgi:hypothetical protein
MATSYGFDGPDVIPGKANIFVFSIGFGTALDPTQPIIDTTGCFVGVKPPGHDADLHPVPRSRMMELYLHFPIYLHGMVLN